LKRYLERPSTWGRRFQNAGLNLIVSDITVSTAAGIANAAFTIVPVRHPHR
jgi:hypothetical protein